MIPADFHEFFAAMVGASSALIGLLFVAISVAPHRFVEVETRSEAQSRAGSSLIALLNVLIFSVIALIPGVNTGWVAVVLGTTGIVFGAASSRVLHDASRRGHVERGWLPLILGLVTVSGWELVEGVLLVSSGRNNGAVTTIAALLVASLGAGIGRAWKLVGMRDTGMFGSVATLLRGDHPDEEQPPAAPSDG